MQYDKKLQTHTHTHTRARAQTQKYYFRQENTNKIIW